MTVSGDALPLVLHNVSLTRGNKRVLKDIDVRFDASPKRTLIIGPNGAGKTLFLHVCHGLVPPDEGTVRWGGHAATPDIAKRQAMVFQRPVLLRRTAEANLRLALSIHGTDKRQRPGRVQTVLRQTGLSRLASRPARSLSFGEQQRLALARAIITEPQVLFLDEPTASLDPSAAHIVEDLVNELAESGVRIIMTSHDLNQARRLADEVIFLHRGRVKERAPTETFFSGPTNDLAAAFVRGELLWWRKSSESGRGSDAHIGSACPPACGPA